jgi:uncharacterized membrane protein YdbT with pleckstrin-like domain
MVNFAAIAKAVDAVFAVRDAARSFTSPHAAEEDPDVGRPQSRIVTVPPPGTALDARLAGVVVAALKEAFDRDHARLELERAQLEEERRRAEAAMRLERHRQAADRELARLRLVGAAALVGWIASVLMIGAGMVGEPMAARATLAGSWLLLLAALGAAFTAQRRVAVVPDDDRAPDSGPWGVASVWLLIAGLAAAAISALL